MLRYNNQLKALSGMSIDSQMAEVGEARPAVQRVPVVVLRTVKCLSFLYNITVID